MFNSISWDSFLITACAIIGTYYAITTVLLYHREITQWFKSKGQKTFDTPTSTTTSPVQSAVMGTTQMESQEIRSSIGTAEEINVAASDEEPDTVHSPEASTPSEEHLLIGNIADLLQEIKTVSQLMTECKSDKAEGESLFRTLLLRYPHLRNTTYQSAINLYIMEAIHEKVVFDISIAEINAWWEDEMPARK